MTSSRIYRSLCGYLTSKFQGHIVGDCVYAFVRIDFIHCPVYNTVYNTRNRDRLKVGRFARDTI